MRSGFTPPATVVVLHLLVVAITELHEGGSITAAMLTGRKILTRKPPDDPRGAGSFFSIRTHDAQDLIRVGRSSRWINVLA
jgi:hypothetical protein